MADKIKMIWKSVDFDNGGSDNIKIVNPLKRTVLKTCTISILIAAMVILLIAIGTAKPVVDDASGAVPTIPVQKANVSASIIDSPAIGYSLNRLQESTSYNSSIISVNISNDFPPNSINKNITVIREANNNANSANYYPLGYFDFYIIGTVQNEYGSPLSNAIVKLIDTSGREVTSTYTRTDGSFTLTALIGTYKLQIVYNSITYTILVNGQEYYYYSQPGATYNFGTIQIWIKVHLLGVVQDEYGSPLSGAIVRFIDQSETVVRETSTGPDGSFTLEEWPGTYRLEIEYNSIKHQMLVNGNDYYNYQPGYYNVGAIQIPIRTTLTGIIQNEFGSPLPSVIVKLTDCSDNYVTSMTTGADGLFNLTALAGSYKLKLVYNSTTYIVIIDEQECYFFPPKNVIFSDPIKLPTKAILTGIIQDELGSPLPGVIVKFTDYFDNDVISTTTGSNGSFTLTAPPGSYKLKLVYNSTTYTVLINGQEYHYYPPGALSLNGPIRLPIQGKQGTIYVDVNNINDNNNPLLGARVYLDDVYKGITDSYGKITLAAAYGSWDVRVETPAGSDCGTQTIQVDGTKYLYFYCANVIDSDGDGFSDSDEVLIGTNPLDPNSNLQSAISSHQISTSCFDLSPLFSLSLTDTQKAALLQSMRGLSLNDIQNLENQNETALYNLLNESNIPPQQIRSGNYSLAQAFKNSNYTESFKVDTYNILLVTDKSTGITSIYAITAACSGQIIGLVNGAGYGLKDDVEFGTAIIEGLIYYAENTKEITSIFGDVQNFISGIPQIFGHLGEIFHDFSISIFEKANTFNSWEGDEANYVSFQLGFYNGYVAGYVVEQTFLLGKVSDAIKAFELGAKLGELSGRALEMMAKLTETFGYDAAKLLKTFGLGERALENWEINALDGLTRIAESSDGIKWISSFSEDVAKRISTSVDNIARDLTGKIGKEGAEKAVSNLLNSEIGKKALIEWSDEEQKGLGLIFGKYGDGVVNNLVSRYGDEIVRITSKGVERSVIDINKVDPEKLAQYIRGVKQLTPPVNDPLEDIGEHQLLKMMKNPHGPTQIVDKGKILESIDGVAVLKKGEHLGPNEGWGWVHMEQEGHISQIKEAFGLTDDEAVKDFISEGLEKGYKDQNKIIWEVPNNNHNLEIIMSYDSPGSIQTAWPPLK